MFSEVQLVDKRQEMIYNASLMKFVSEMQKKPITLKAVIVKPVQTAKPKMNAQPKPTTAYISHSLGQKRTI